MNVDDLGEAGRALHDAMLAELADDGLQFDARESTLLVRACVIADTLEEIDRVLATDGLTVRGSRNQIAPHPLLSERRLQEQNLMRALKAVGLPTDLAVTSATKRAAARKRWGNHG